MNSTLTPQRDPAPDKARPWYRKRWFIITAVAVVLLGGAAGGGIWWYLRDDAPASVDLESATQSLDTATADTTADVATTVTNADSGVATDPAVSPTTVAAFTAAVSGTWSVDTSIGEFNFEDSTGTFVGFRVEEELSGIGSTTAVGRTPTVTGSITLDGTTLTAATIEADMTAITTNDSRRDDSVQDVLETDVVPSATFTLTAPIDLGDTVATGAPITVEAIGDLTIHGVTTPVTLPLDAQVVGDTIVVVGSLDIALSTYGVEAPTAPIVVSVSDQATIELQLFFSQA